MAGRPFDPTLIGKLDNLANRGYTDGFYQRHPTQEQQNYMVGYSSSDRQQYVGEIIGYDTDHQSLEIDVKNKFSIGDKLELVLPEGNIEFTLEKLINQDGEAIDVALGSGHKVKVPYTGNIPEKGLLARYL
jgi:putative protease